MLTCGPSLCFRAGYFQTNAHCLNGPCAPGSLGGGVWHEVSSGGGLHAAANYWCHPPDGASFARPYTSSFWADDWARRRRDDPLLKT